jgi:hypothetical protein
LLLTLTWLVEEQQRLRYVCELREWNTVCCQSVLNLASMEAQRRLQIISGHLVPHGATRPDVLALQRLLDHDNLELRARMKDFFKDELYVPR